MNMFNVAKHIGKKKEDEEEELLCLWKGKDVVNKSSCLCVQWSTDGQSVAAGGSDGLTQGSVASRLEQSSTVADHVEVTFGCGKEERLPCAFLELIQRHDGFRGFLGQNAKGIFASTHAGRS